MTPEGMLVQAFIPTARDITVKLSATGKQYQMEMADEAGFFAALIPRKTLADYTLLVFYDNGTLSEIHDPYSFAPQFTESDLKKFEAGIHYSIYNKMGRASDDGQRCERRLFCSLGAGSDARERRR